MLAFSNAGLEVSILESWLSLCSEYEYELEYDFMVRGDEAGVERLLNLPI